MLPHISWLLTVTLPFVALAADAPRRPEIPPEVVQQIERDIEAIEPNQVISDNIAGLSSLLPATRQTAFQELSFKLSVAYNKRRYPTAENKKLLSTALVKYSKSMLTSSSERRDVLQAITKYGENSVAKPYIMGVLNSNDKADRDAVLAVLGAPGGISDDELYDKVEELAKNGAIKSEARTTMLARVDKPRALKEIIKDLETTKDKEHFVYSAWALQDYFRDPANYRYIVPRLKEFGLESDGRIMNKSFKGGSGIGWMDGELFSQYIESAPEAEAKRAFDIMVRDGLLCKPATVPMLLRMLKHKNPDFRVYAARGLRKAAGYSQSDMAAIKSGLRAAIDSETLPETKASLDGELKGIERYEVQWNETLKRLGR